MLRSALLIGLLAFVLGGCATPKPPPGWPSGAERPINPSHGTKAVK